MAKSDVLAVLDRMVASVGARADRNRDADLAAAHEARAAVAELIDAAKYALGTRDDAGALGDTAEHNLRAALALCSTEAV